MREQLVSLAKLATIDDAAADLEAQLESIPAAVEEMRADVARLEEFLNRERSDVEEAERLRRAQGEDLKERNEALSRAKAKGAKARTPKEADAAEREVEANRRMIKDREDEILKLEEALEKARASLAKHETEFSEFKAVFDERETESNTTLARVRAERDRVIDGREAIAAAVDRTTLSRYTRIRAQKGSAVAVIDTATCSGCRVNVSPQSFIELQRGEEMINCPGCLRFLIYQDLVADELAALNAARSAAGQSSSAPVASEEPEAARSDDPPSADAPAEDAQSAST